LELHHSRILIIAPNFQPERCGISDYVSVLNVYLRNSGCKSVFILSLSDRFINEVVQEDDYMRIPLKYAYNLRRKLVKEIVLQFSPTHVLFNFVPYGFSVKGLPFWLSRYKKVFPAPIRVSFIMHELWTGDHDAYNGKVKLLGAVQQKLIVHLLHGFKPYSIVTTSPYTTQLLLQHGFSSTACRVFCNIVASSNSDEVPIHIRNLMERGGGINVVFFGSITNDSTCKDIMLCLKQLKDANKRNLNIIATGSLKTTDNNLWAQLKANAFNGLSVYETGHLSPEGIAWVLAQADIGLSTYPIELWSKSGGIAAMLGHGLPVVVFGNIGIKDWKNYKAFLPDNLYYWPELTTASLEVIIHQKTANQVQDYNQLTYKYLREGLKF
jgi:hypothetical protein